MIDLWDVDTFDADVIDLLEKNEAVVRNYVEEENRIFLSYDLQRDQSLFIRPRNQHATAYMELEENVHDLIASSSIRGFHYTRLTEDEVERLGCHGIELSSSDTLRNRLAAQVNFGRISKESASQLYNLSPLQNGQKENRSGQFWLASYPVVVTDHRVQPLLGHWGGEVVYMWLQNPSLIQMVEKIGRATVLEVCVPLSATNDVFSASKAIVRTFAHSLGLNAENGEFDVCVRENLPPEAILKVHQEDSMEFKSLGCGYPESYVKNDEIWWEEYE
ncbi:hypothetical protein [Thalassospira povalilytica]|uniref:Uncharacterized protein n=1 Tax=Thalassospira povalilytica TaxID=732237 RepID=A0A8I1MAC1_9PROT|nr:hypothetical protein [Thalassospira povalilytica]MBN8197766.1 hypothetical protein [Thalassospira povalilytica]